MKNILHKLKQNKAVCLAWVVLSKMTVVNEKELKLLRRLIKTGDTVLDIGANIGSYTYALSSAVGNSGKVFAFEPLPDNLQILFFIKNFLRLSNTTVIPEALSDMQGKMSLSVPIIDGMKKNTRAHLVYEHSSSSITAKVTTLSEIADRYKLNHIDFIKCDAEGAEKMVIAGGECIIKKCAPIILCELGEASKNYGLNDSEVFNYIKKLCDYDVYVFVNDELKPVDEFKKEYNNYVYVKQNHLERVRK